MQITVDAGDLARQLRTVCSAESARVRSAVDGAIRDATDGLKEELRDRTFVALGRKVAYAWQGRFYPNKGQQGGPAGFVYTKAPKIIDFFRAERIVTPIGNAFAIPVNPVVKRFGRAMSIAEVEAKFNQDLQPRRLASGNIGLFADLVRARSGRGFRQATKGRTAKGRKPELVLLFVLVRNIRSKKLIDLVGPATRWADQVPRLIDEKLGGSE